MAERRMFAKSIVLSDAFLDMSMGARCLYFTLGMLADDDGFVNSPKSIMRQCGSNEEDLKELISKKFILAFESGVITIKHWKMHNWIRSERKHDTKYEEEFNKLDIDKEGIYHLKPNSTDNNLLFGRQMSDKCQTKDRQQSDSCHTEDSIGKDSIGKDSINNNMSNKSLSDSVDWKALVEKFTELCPSQPKLRGALSESRKGKVKTLLKTFTINDIYEAFSLTEQSDFLTGRDGKWRACGFDWIIEGRNFQKIIEKNYLASSQPRTSHVCNDPKAFEEYDDGHGGVDFDKLMSEYGR